MKIAGIDEAGRGSQLGPMIVCGVAIEKSQEAALVAAGVKDSKELTPAQRLEIFKKLEALGIQKEYVVVSHEQIDKNNLTQLEVEAAASILKKLRPDIVYIDAPVQSGRIDSFVERLYHRLNQLGCRMQIIAENEADKKFVVVGAASIIAKVVRDEIMDKLIPEAGSGYPSDPKTVNLILKTIFDGEINRLPLRRRWKIGKMIKKAQKKLFEGF